MTKVRNSCVGTDPTEQDWLQPGSDACQVHLWVCHLVVVGWCSWERPVPPSSAGPFALPRVTWYELQRDLHMVNTWWCRERLSCTLWAAATSAGLGLLSRSLRPKATYLGFANFCEILGKSTS